MIPYKQLSLADIFSDCQQIFDHDKPAFLSLLETHIDRTVVERDINHIKDSLCLAGRRTQNEKTLHADLILAGITQLITVVLADKINHHEYIRSLKPLIA